MLKQFSKTVSIYGLAPAFSKSVGLLLIPFYTRVFCPEEYGVIDLFNTLVHLFTVLINLQIYSAVGRYFAQSTNKKLLVSTALWNEVLLSIIIVSPLIFLSTDINRILLGDITYKTVLILALLWIPFNVLSTYTSVVMRFENKPLVYIQVAVLQTIVNVAVSVTTVFVLKFGVAGIYIGCISGDLTALCFFSFFLRKYIGLQFNFSLLKKLLFFSLPLVPATFALYSSDFINRVVMLEYLSLSAIGIFAVALKVASVLGLISMALRMAWEPFIYENLDRKDHKEQFVRIYKMILIFLGLIVCAISFFSREILLVITTKEYFSAMSVIGILSINFVFKILSELVGIGPKIVRKTIYYSISRVTGVAVGVLSLLLLIPLLGIMGAALAICLGSGASFALSWYYTEKYYPVGYPKLFTLLVVAFMFLVVILNNFYAVPVTFKIAGSLLSLFILIYSRKSIKNIIDSSLVF